MKRITPQAYLYTEEDINAGFYRAKEDCVITYRAYVSLGCGCCHDRVLDFEDVKTGQVIEIVSDSNKWNMDNDKEWFVKYFEFVGGPND